MIKILIALFLQTFFASSVLAQDQIQQQTPPSVQTDTTSGWQLVFHDPDATITGHVITNLQFPSKDTGYAVAFNGVHDILLRSTNAGLTWDSLPTPIAGYPIHFTTALTGYAAGRSADKLVWKTVDGGMSWKSHSENSNATGFFAFANKDTGCVFGNGIARTTDAGETWDDIPTILGEVTTNDGSFGDSKVGYIVGPRFYDPPTYPSNSGFCEKTTDGGATWNFVNTSVPADLLCCQALDPNTLYVGCEQSYFVKTINGGITWDTIVLVSPNGGLQAISFLTKAKGLTVGADVAHNSFYGVIFSTSDSCKTWQRLYLPNAPSLYGVQMLNDSVAVICGDGNIYHTTTGGNFSSVTNTNYNFQLKLFPNPSTGFVRIQYLIPSQEPVSFLFNNVNGVKIGSINAGIQNAGAHQIIYDGSKLSNGVYYFVINAGSFHQSGSFTIQR